MTHLPSVFVLLVVEIERYVSSQLHILSIVQTANNDLLWKYLNII